MQYILSNRNKGFTLIEMIVALALFAIVAVVALGALMKIISANKKAQSLQSAITNINYALESISREMRVGSNFSCIANPSSYTVSSLDSVSVEDCRGTYKSSDNRADGDNLIVLFK